MSDTNGTGVVYPTVELGGRIYVVKFTRGGILYRLSKAGVDLAALGTVHGFATIIDTLHAALFGQYVGDAESLAELVLAEDKAEQVGEAVSEALKKAFPPIQTPAAGPADQIAAPIQ